MPSYNHGSYISEAIESVLTQGFKDIELIIVDDGSKDNSEVIIKSYLEKDGRIHTIFHKENMGIARTLNDGINRAQGKFVAFIASDDVWTKSKLEKELAELAKNEAIIIWSEGEIIDSESKPTGKTFTLIHGASQKKKSGDIFDELLYGNFVFGSSLIFKREYTKNINFDENLKYLNDYRFVVDLARKHTFHFISEPLAKYRVHGKNTILQDRLGWIRDEITVNEYFIEKYGDQISKRARANIFFRTGLAYSSLGEKAVGRWLLFKAIIVSIIHNENMASLAEIAAKGSSRGKILAKCIYTIDALPVQFRKKNNAYGMTWKFFPHPCNRCL